MSGDSRAAAARRDDTSVALAALFIAEAIMCVWQWFFAGYFYLAYIIGTAALLLALVAAILVVPFVCALRALRQQTHAPSPALLLVAVLTVWLVKPYHPSDASLAWRLHTHATDFAALGGALQDDMSRNRRTSVELVISRDHMENTTKLPPSHEQEARYVALTERLGCPYGLYTAGGTAFLQVENWGFAGDWDAKGYAYTLSPLRNTVATLDTGSGRWRQYRFRHLTGHWYLFDYRS
ncbi:MAG: hypothetical protein ACR2MQ_16370 [Gemmatimonadaceae bacterium]